MTTEVRDLASEARASSTRPKSFIGVEPEAAPFGFVLLRARVVGRHRCGIDDDAGSRRGNDGRRLPGRGAGVRFGRLWRERRRWSGRGDRLGWRGGRRRGRRTLGRGGDALVRGAPDEAVKRSRRRDRRPTVADDAIRHPGLVARGARGATEPLAHRAVISLRPLDVGPPQTYPNRRD